MVLLDNAVAEREFPCCAQLSMQEIALAPCMQLDWLVGIVAETEINEIIVVDDGSSDKTTKFASEVNSEKIIVLKLDKNKVSLTMIK